eukprot:1031010-Prorocentrum_minimum.AAC.1
MSVHPCRYWHRRTPPRTCGPRVELLSTLYPTLSVCDARPRSVSSVVMCALPKHHPCHPCQASPCDDVGYYGVAVRCHVVYLV